MHLDWKAPIISWLLSFSPFITSLSPSTVVAKTPCGCYKKVNKHERSTIVDKLTQPVALVQEWANYSPLDFLEINSKSVRVSFFSLCWVTKTPYCSAPAPAPLSNFRIHCVPPLQRSHPCSSHTPSGTFGVLLTVRDVYDRRRLVMFHHSHHLAVHVGGSGLL